MKKGTEIIVTDAFAGQPYKNGDKAVYNGAHSFLFGNGMQYRLYPYEYEEVREPHIFDQIIEEIKKYKLYTSINIFSDKSGGILNQRNKEVFSFGSHNGRLEGALDWLKEQNKPKEETINVEGQDMTLAELKQMIKERESK